MKQVKCVVDKDFYVGTAGTELFSSFIEHLGRAVYNGIYEPGHPEADSRGFRKDVIKCIKEMSIGLIRYPGGNFLSNYDWKDGIGPKDKRPVRLDLAWKSIETNEFGIDEFADWTKECGAGIMGAVNLGTGNPKDAAELLEYCNHPSGTYWSDMRIANGHKDPHNIKVWCLGNEMDGPWQIGQMTSDDYGKKARETAKIMRLVDPSIKLVACGSSTTRIPTYPEWDRTVLEHLYEYADYLSLHRYYENEGNDDDFLASFYDMDSFIKTIAGTVGYVKAKTRSKKQVFLSFDEWNIWYMQNQTDHPWQKAPELLEDNYSLLDSLVFGGLVCTLLNNCDMVKMACLAQLINVIAPVMTKPGGGIFKQTTYYPFVQAAECAGGKVLKTFVNSPEKETPMYGAVPGVQSSLVYQEEKGVITLFALNSFNNDSAEFSVDLRSFGNVEFLSHSEMSGSDLHAKNSFAEPQKVLPREAKTMPVVDSAGKISVVFQPLSWNTVKFRVK